jgi:hypothetical protein
VWLRLAIVPLAHAISAALSARPAPGTYRFQYIDVNMVAMQSALPLPPGVPQAAFQQRPSPTPSQPAAPSLPRSKPDTLSSINPQVQSRPSPVSRRLAAKPVRPSQRETVRWSPTRELLTNPRVSPADVQRRASAAASSNPPNVMVSTA